MVVGQTVYINGYLNSYFKDGLLINYIYPIDIKNYSNYKKVKLLPMILMGLCYGMVKDVLKWIAHQRIKKN